jgi:hypothetical protein
MHKLTPVLAATFVLAGCGSSTETTATKMATKTAPTKPAYANPLEEDHADQAAFERRFRQIASKGYLQQRTVRFRTPCRSEGNGKLKCEGWGKESTHAPGQSPNCFVLTAIVTAGSIAELHEEVEGPATDVLCKEGDKEGQPPGDLNAEDPEHPTPNP